MKVTKVRLSEEELFAVDQALTTVATAGNQDQGFGDGILKFGASELEACLQVEDDMRITGTAVEFNIGIEYFDVKYDTRSEPLPDTTSTNATDSFKQQVQPGSYKKGDCIARVKASVNSEVFARFKISVTDDTNLVSGTVNGGLNFDGVSV